MENPVESGRKTYTVSIITRVTGGRNAIELQKTRSLIEKCNEYPNSLAYARPRERDCDIITVLTRYVS